MTQFEEDGGIGEFFQGYTKPNLQDYINILRHDRAIQNHLRPVSMPGSH